MRPLSPSALPPGFMSSCETDDEIFLVLNQINRGSPIPADVIEINPYQCDPSHLPDEGLPETITLPPRGSEGPGSSLVDNFRDQSVDDKEAEIDCIRRGDYMELNDLIDGASHDSSSSENTSRQSFASDEFFNSRALLAELNDEKEENLSGKGSTSNHYIMMSEIANDVVEQPGPLGFLFKGSDVKAKETQQAPDNDKSKSPDQAAKKLKTAKKLKAKDEGPSHARRATTSSTSSNSSSDEPGRAARREEKRTKKLMKFLCFLSF